MNMIPDTVNIDHLEQWAGPMGKAIMPTDEHELELRDLGFERIAGVDEVGRGAIAGPVVAAAVLLPCGCTIDGVRDSKMVPEPERETLYEAITACAIAWGVGIVSHEEIDRINILQATFVAMRIAVSALELAPDYVLIDGRDAVQVGIPSRAIIAGDALCRSIAAASIVAKVTRDRIMRAHDSSMPRYGFARHKGYATVEHRRAVLEHGPTSIHRMTFLTRLLISDQQPGENSKFKRQNSKRGE
jgi:ribonuclease HII